MTLLGAGVMSCGTGPAGLYSVDDPLPVPTGITTGVRYVDPVTGQYEIDTTTLHFRQTTSVLQRVTLILRTVMRSCGGVPTMGVVWPRKMGDRFPAQIEAAIRKALRYMTDVEKSIRIEEIIPMRGMIRGGATVRYRNLLTGETEKAEV